MTDEQFGRELWLAAWMVAKAMEHEIDDVCGFCGLSGADKIPHPVRWPGERSPGTPYVHADCERAVCAEAHARLSDQERERFLLTIR